MQIGKAGSYVWARACPAAETVPIAKIANARMRIGTPFEFGTISSAHVDLSQLTFLRGCVGAAREIQIVCLSRSGRGAVARPLVQVRLVTRIHRGERRRPSLPRKAPVMARGPG